MADSPRPVGRPRVGGKDSTTTRVSISIPSTQFDRFYQQAQQQRISVAEVIRRRVDDDDGDE